MNLLALLAALPAAVGVYAHGVLGHRWFTAQLASVDMRPTRLSTRLFGDQDVSNQVFGLTWHSMTAVFFAAAVALSLSGLGIVESRELLRFIAIIYAAFLGLALVYIVKGPHVLRGPIPPLFVVGMAIAAVLAWTASDSL